MEGSVSPAKRSKPILDDSNGVVRLVREQPPEHCILKVNSFSVLDDALPASKHHIDSKEFKAGGFTWVLYVYPKGNKQEGGGGHLSLYVALVDKLEFGASVNVALRFFIYDQIRDNYLAFIDIRDKCYALKTSWGITKLMPLESFTNASNGFLVNDCCVFGAEVLLRDSQPKRSIVTILTSTTPSSTCDMSYTWNVEKFSDLKDRCYSPVFGFGEWSWKLSLYPRGHKGVEGEYVSLYLELVNVNELTHGKNLYAKFCLSIKNQGKSADQSKFAQNRFSLGTIDWGFASFLAIRDVYDTSKGFLVDDSLIVEVKIEVILRTL